MPLLLYGTVAAIGLALGLWQYSANGWTEEGTQLFTRYTARVSFLMFLLVFVARPVFVLWPSPTTVAMVRQRRHFGLAFGLAHGIHLLGIISYLWIIGSVLEASDAVPAFGYLMVGLMAITSNNWSVRTLGRGWKVLHKFGLYVIFAIFFLAYAGRLFGAYDDVPEAAVAMGAKAIYAGLFALAVIALGLRVAAFFKTRLTPRR